MTGQIIRLQLIDRRAALTGGLLALGGGAFALGRQPPADGGVCRLYPQQTEGPFYLDPKMQRSDITENRPGSPLELIVGVQGPDCRPLAGARVDVWHCDSQGTYSGFDAPEQSDARGQTFLRGWLPTAANGEAAFKTIYPGWYPGRTPHIHLKVILQDSTVLTSQLYFPEELSDAVYRRREYAKAGTRYRNANDGIFRQGGAQTIAAIAPQGEGHLARLRVAVDPAAGAAASPPGRRGPPR